MKRLLGFVVVVVGGLALLSGLDLARDYIEAPWSHATPPLAAAWEGRLVTGNGASLAVDLELAYRRPRGRCSHCNTITGRAATCTAGGEVRRYEVTGAAEDRHASRFHLGATPATKPEPQGLELSTLAGRWDRADALVLDADFVWRRGRSAVASTDDPATQPVPLRMARRAAGARPACGA